jgi:hypothetical protein
MKTTIAFSSKTSLYSVHLQNIPRQNVLATKHLKYKTPQDITSQLQKVPTAKHPKKQNIPSLKTSQASKHPNYETSQIQKVPAIKCSKLLEKKTYIVYKYVEENVGISSEIIFLQTRYWFKGPVQRDLRRVKSGINQ